MEVEFTYEKEDWSRFQGFLEKDIPKRIKTPWDNTIVSIVLWAVIGAVAMFVFRHFERFHWPTAGYVTAFATVLFALFIRYMYRIKNAFAPSESGCFIGTHKFTITESGIESKGRGYYGFHAWSVVKEIVRDNGLIILFTDTANAFIFPEHKIDNPDGLYNYVKECNKQLSSDSGADAPPLAS
ncbi:MAG: YcxB family protein [Sedimenticola sp.]